MRDDIRLALREALSIKGVVYEVVKPDGHDKPIYISKEGILGMNGEAISWKEINQYEALSQSPDLGKAVEKFNSQFEKNRREKFKMHN